MVFFSLIRNFAAVRKNTLIIVLLFVLTFVMAELPRLHFPQEVRDEDSLRVDSVKTDTLTADRSAKKTEEDTLSMDSLQKAIWKHNKAIDDSLHADSLNRERKKGIDAPVEYQADDSMTY